MYKGMYRGMYRGVYRGMYKGMFRGGLMYTMGVCNVLICWVFVSVF